MQILGFSEESQTRALVVREVNKVLRPLTATDVNIGTNTGTFLNMTFGIFQVTSVTGRFKVT